jgi:uncharacterized membrane protein YphA (DoxX/SURF4 family)
MLGTLRGIDVSATGLNQDGQPPVRSGASNGTGQSLRHNVGQERVTAHACQSCCHLNLLDRLDGTFFPRFCRRARNLKRDPGKVHRSPSKKSNNRRDGGPAHGLLLDNTGISRHHGYKDAVTISRRIARPLLASIFIAEGWSAIRNPNAAGKALEPPSQPAAKDGAPLIDDPITVARLNGIVQVGGGVLLAIGKFPRLASLALIGSIVPTTYAGHRFWEEPDADKRAQQQTQLLKNLGLLGGLIFAAVDTEGAPSVGWRTRRRVHQTASMLTEGRGSSEGPALQTATKAVDAGRNAGRRANRAAKVAARRTNATAADVARQASEIATHATKAGVVLASPRLRQANEGALDAVEGAIDVAGPYISAGLERAGDLIEEALDVAGPYITSGLERAEGLLARVPGHPSVD